MKKNNPTYNLKKNIVGIDLQYENMNNDVLDNNEKKNFWLQNKNIINIVSKQKNTY